MARYRRSLPASIEKTSVAEGNNDAIKIIKRRASEYRGEESFSPKPVRLSQVSQNEPEDRYLVEPHPRSWTRRRWPSKPTIKLFGGDAHGVGWPALWDATMAIAMNSQGAWVNIDTETL